MSRFVFAAAVLGLLLGLTTVANAQDEKKKKKKAPDSGAVFAKLDANTDKKISKDEFGKFTGLAEKKPGKEGKEPKGLAALRDGWFVKLDANSDGSADR